MTANTHTASSPEQAERTFFLVMAVVIAVTVAAGFTLFLGAGISSFNAPWWVHVHAVTFMGWIVIYIAQNIFVFRNDIAHHRTLGRIGAIYWMWMVVVGLVLTPLTLAVGRSPPFFTPPYFLALDWVNIFAFGVLASAAIRMRRQTDWHRRLMFCATVCVIAPALGRLIVLSGNTMTAPLNVALLLPYVIVAMVTDRMIRGRIHPAWWWGLIAIVAMAPAIEVLVRLGPFVALAESIAAQ